MSLKGFLNSSDINTIKLDKNNTKIRYASPEAGKDVECVISDINSESNNTFTIGGEGAENYELDTSYIPKITSNIHKRPIIAKLYNVVKEYDGTDSVPSQLICWELLPTDSSESGIVEGTSTSAQDGGFAELTKIRVVDGGEGYEIGDTFAILFNSKRYQQHYQHEVNPELGNFLQFKATKLKSDFSNGIAEVAIVPSGTPNAYTIQTDLDHPDDTSMSIYVADPCYGIRLDCPTQTQVIKRYKQYQSPDTLYETGWSIIPLFNRKTTSTDLTIRQDPGGAIFELQFKIHPNVSSSDVPTKIPSDRDLVNISSPDISFPDKNVTTNLVPLNIKMPALTGYQKANYELTGCSGYGVITPKIIHNLTFVPHKKEYDGTCCLNCSIYTDDKLVDGDDIQFVVDSKVIYQKTPVSNVVDYHYSGDNYLTSVEYRRLLRAIELTGEDAKNYRIIRPQITIDNSLLEITPRPVYINNLKLVVDAYTKNWEITYELNNVLSQDSVDINLYGGTVEFTVTIEFRIDDDENNPMFLQLPINDIQSVDIFYRNGAVAGIYFNTDFNKFPVNIAEASNMKLHIPRRILKTITLFNSTKCLYELHLDGDYIPIKLEVINA